MDTDADLTTILRTFMRQARRTPSDLAHLTGIALDTLGNWTAGKVRRPRLVSDVLKLVRALTLDAGFSMTNDVAEPRRAPAQPCNGTGRAGGI